MTGKIDRNLNIMMTVDTADGRELHVHATPLSAAVFDQFWLPLTRTYSALIDQGGQWLSLVGPKMATRMLRDVALELGVWAAPAVPDPAAKPTVERDLMSEIRRTTSVIYRTEAGWENVPLQHAIDQKMILKEDAEEVESFIVFFIVCLASMRKEDVAGLPLAFGAMGVQVSSSSASDYLNSLRTSTPADNSGETATASSIAV